MNEIIVTIDTDWACEPAIISTINFLRNMNFTPTVFLTHPSSYVKTHLDSLEVALHPFFSSNSSQGSNFEEIKDYVLKLPHNLKAFRCHQFKVSNSIYQVMQDAGMLISSNVCTDLELLQPFKNRFGMLEIPIFFEDGGYLWQKHDLEFSNNLIDLMNQNGAKVLLIHPMHFVVNTPNFQYMRQIKQSMTREKWNNLSYKDLDSLKWKGRGIRDFITDLLNISHSPLSFTELYSRQYVLNKHSRL